MKSVLTAGGNEIQREQRRALAASGVGTVVEFFDYASYIYLATTLATVFFPEGDQAVSLLQTFGIFAISFLMRPIGGLFWGHYGDRLGRKKSLVFTIVGMGTATSALAVLPPFAVIGMWAPLLLVTFRLLQSFFAAGQYAGAAVLAGEFAPPLKRARYVCIVPIGSVAGFMLASALASLLHATLTPEEMIEWGWRIPFAAGGVLTLVGWVIRRALGETPAFEGLQHSDEISTAPITNLVTNHWKLTLKLICIAAVNFAGYYILLGYMTTYLETERGFSSSEAGIITTVALFVYLPMVYSFSFLSDKFGRRKILLASSILLLTLSYPAFFALSSAGFWLTLVIQLCLAAFLALNDAAFPVLLVESFPAKIRYSGFALPFNIAAAVFGGASPLVADWLIRMTGDALMPAWIITALAALSLPALLTIRETAPGVAPQSSGVDEGMMPSTS